jgi:TRAP transporter 4TM/12TM fusion protein
VVNHQWVTTEGVFGIALGVSTSFVFLFVLFGALLDKAGAGNYFIKVAFSLLGHFRGGPAKAAVVSSGLTGLISGSSIANVVTTGTFTIPMMKRVGFTSEMAGAVEVASSVNGQIMPPVMGAAAFLMVEYVGIPYVEVIKHAFLPALISYIALVYIVHLEAVKADMQGLPRPGAPKPWVQKIMGILLGFIGIMALAAGVYYGIGWMKPAFGDAASWIISALVGVVYVVLVGYGSRYPDLPLDDPNSPVVSLPEVGPTVKTGLHYILPVLVLVWCLMVEQLSPGLSAFWATVLMMFILITQRPITAMFRGNGGVGSEARRGFDELIDGLISGARNMIGIGIATATAGIIVGAVSQTGVGLVLADLVEVLSLGNVMLMLILTAVLSLILGMGLPTTANYIVVSSLLAPVVVALGEQNGLIVPLIAVHLFVFYFGIMADVTPPVGLASFAAAAVSGGDPIRTGLVAFFYSLRTAALPFLFIFNTDLLLIDVDWAHGIIIFVVSTVAMLIFAAATQGWFLDRCRSYEIVVLLLIAFTLFRPGYWMDKMVEPVNDMAPEQIEEAAGQVAPDGELRLQVAGEDDVGNPREFVAILPLAAGASGKERLADAGLEIVELDGAIVVDNAAFGSVAEKAGFSFDQKILMVRVPAEQPAKEWLWIPALAVLALIAFMQRRRRKTEPATAAA